jgi:chromatin structure-remodeling complex subunit RSC1/2
MNQSILLSEWKSRQVLPSPPEAPKEPTTISTRAAALTRTESYASSTVPPVDASMTVDPSMTSAATAPPYSLPPRPRSPTPDVDVDAERGTPEAEGGAEEEAREDESQAIVVQLEKGVPRWQGFENIGWNTTLTQVS